MPNPFDQFDKPAENPFDQFDPGYKAPERSAIRGLADLGVEAVSGVARGVKFTADAFGANNPVSRAAGAVDDFAREYLSAQAKQDDKRIGEIMATAQDAGIWEQVKAAAEAFVQAPARMAVNALGTSVPTIATALIPGVGQAGVVGRLGALGGMGAVQGAGTVKGSIYEAVKAEQMKQPGMTEEMADELATRAQEYGGDNTGNIAAGAALGAAASSTGAQPVIAKMLQGRGMLANQATQAAERGVFARTGIGALKEAPLEAAQGGQEQLAGNMAVQNEGFDVPTWRGVAGQAALEGLAAAPMGGVAGAFDRAPKVVEQPDAAPVAAILAAPDINAAIEATKRAIEEPNAREKRAALADEILQLPQELQAEAKGLLATTGNWVPSPHVRAFAQSRLEEMLAPLRTIPVGEVIEDPAGTIPVPDMQELTSTEATSQILQPPDPAQVRAVGTRIPTGRATEIAPENIELGTQIPVGDVIEAGGDVPRPDGMPERRNTDGLALDFGTPQHFNAPHSVFQYVQTIAGLGTPASRAFVQDYKAGRITNDDVLNLLVPTRREPTANQRLEAAAAQAPKTEDLKPGDLLTSDGKPYGVRVAAAVRAKKEGGTVVEVQGGWAVRPKESPGAQPDLPVPAAVAVRAPDGSGDQPGGSGGTVRPVADDGRTGQVYPGVPEAAASGIADRPAAGPGSERDQALSDDLPTLKAAWSDAAARGDDAAMKRINDRIVQAKQAPSVNPAPGAGLQAPAVAPLKYGRDTMRKATDEPWQEKFYTERTDNGRVRLVSYKNFNGLGAFDTEEQAAQEARALAQPAQGTHDQRRAFLDTLSDDALRKLVKKLGQPTYDKGVEPLVARRLHEGFALSFTLDRLQVVAGEATAPTVAQKLKAKRSKKTPAHPLESSGWAAETASPANTIWTKRVGGERYTAILTPAADGKPARMEVTALVDSVDTQIDQFTVDSPEAAAMLAEKAIADDAAQTATPAPTPPAQAKDDANTRARNWAERTAMPDERAANEAANSAAANDPTLDDELNAALGHLGDVLGDVFGAKLNITGPQHSAGDLLPALSKVVELLVRKGFKSFGQAASKAAQLMRANPKTAAHVDAISPRQWKAAYQAIGDLFPGTDSEEQVSAMSADDVLRITGKQPESFGPASRNSADAGVESSPTQVVQNGNLTESNPLTNLGAVKPGIEQGNGQVEIQALRSVQRLMGRIGQDFKILKSVVQLIPVDVVDVLVGQQLSAEMLFHDPAMLEHIAVVRGDAPISSRVNAARSVIEAVARATAEDARLVDLGGVSIDFSAALRAVDRWQDGAPENEFGNDGPKSSGKSYNAIVEPAAPTLADKIKAKRAEAAPQPAPEPVAEEAAPQPEPEPEPAPAPAPEATPPRNDALIDLRKQLSVLKALRVCLG